MDPGPVTVAARLLLLVVLVVVLGGCGGDDGKDTAPAPDADPMAETMATSAPSEVDDLVDPTAPDAPPGPEPGADVRQAVEAYLLALADGDGAAGCAALTPEAAGEFTRTASEEVGGETCAEVFAAVGDQLSDEERAAFRGARVAVPVVSGAGAEVAVSIGDRATTVVLSRRGGVWLVDVAPAEAGTGAPESPAP